MNLYEELKYTIKRNKRKMSDIQWVGNRKYKVNLEDFLKMAQETYYTQGYSDLQFPEDLIVRGEDFWVEVDDYDGSLSLEFKLIPTEPKRELKLESLNQISVKKEKVGEDIEYTFLSSYRETYEAQQESRKNNLISTSSASNFEDIQELAKELNEKDREILGRMNNNLKNKQKEGNIYE